MTSLQWNINFTSLIKNAVVCCCSGHQWYCLQLTAAAAVVEGRSADRKENPLLMSSPGESENIGRKKTYMQHAWKKKSLLLCYFKCILTMSV